MENKKSYGLIIGIIIGVLLGGIVVYFVMVKNNKPTTITNNTQTEKKAEEKNSEQSEEIDELGRKLFEKTTNFVDGQGSFMFYLCDENAVEKLQYNDLKAASKLNFAYINVSDSDKTIHERQSDVCEAFLDCNEEIISKNIFEEAYYDLFGSDKIINYVPFTTAWMDCELDEDNIRCTNSITGYEWAGMELLQYKNATLLNNDIIIKVDFLIYYGEEYGVYVRNKKIDSGNYIYHFIKDGSLDEESKNKIFDHYKESVGTFKVTFKKDKNNSDNYYWYSTELVK